jgi:hypothetical protein
MSRWFSVLPVLSLLVFLATGNAVGETLFYDNFENGVISNAWKFSGTDLPQTNAGTPEWVEAGGVFSQTSTSQGDEAHAVIMDQEFPELITMEAKVRLDSWQDGDTARAGLVLRVGADTGRGYNFLFHNNLSTIQFLNDQSAWGNTASYSFEIGPWYWMQFHIDADQTLHAKVWADGEAEPNAWMLEQAAFGEARPWEGSYPALNGGTSPHGGSVTISYDDVQIWDEAGPSPVTAVKPTEKASITWGELKR